MGVAVDETGRKAYVALFGVDHLVEVDLATQSLNWRVSLPRPTNVAIDGDEIYVLTLGNKVEAIHRRTQNSRKSNAEVPARIDDILFNALPPWFVAPDANRPAGRQLLTPVHSPTIHDTAVDLLRDAPFDNRLTVSTLRESETFPAMHSVPHAPPRIASPNNFQVHWDSAAAFKAHWGSRAGQPNGAGLGWRLQCAVRPARFCIRRRHAGCGGDARRFQYGVRLGDGLGLRAGSRSGAAEFVSDSEIEIARRSAGLLQARLPTKSGPGPMALSGDGKVLVVANTLADSLTVISTGKSPRVVAHVSLGGPPLDAVRRGEPLIPLSQTLENRPIRLRLLPSARRQRLRDLDDAGKQRQAHTEAALHSS